MQTGYIISVSQLNEYVNGLLSRDPLLCEVTVQGEITGFKRHTSGHLYFSLKDESAQVRCVMFRQYAQMLSMTPAEGMKVSALGAVSLYVAGGQYQLYVKSLREQGEGELYQRFLMVKAKLQAQGYFDQQRKRQLPFLPRCIGVVTSPCGAVIQDIRNVIARRFPGMHLCLAPAKVQGPGAAADIAAAIKKLEAQGDCDVIIVGRGGGSAEDLFAFNEEIVAEAIFRCTAPVVSAVGHETDVTIADFVADLRAPTPSAAAELCVPERAKLLAELQAAGRRLCLGASSAIEQRRRQLNSLFDTGALLAPSGAFAARRRELVHQKELLLARAREALLAQRAHIAGLSGALALSDPVRLAGRGYALVTDEAGRRVTGAAQLLPGALIGLRLLDGTAQARVESVQRSHTDER